MIQHQPKTTVKTKSLAKSERVLNIPLIRYKYGGSQLQPHLYQDCKSEKEWQLRVMHMPKAELKRSQYYVI